MTIQSERLRKAREEAGFESAAAAARAHGWTEATYRHHENGTRGFGSDHANAYGKAFKVNSAWLAGLSEASTRGEEQAFSDYVYEFDGYTGELGDLENALIENTGQCFVRHISVDSIMNSGRVAFYMFGEKEVAFETKLLKSISVLNFRDIVAMSAFSNEMSPTITEGAMLLIDIGNREPTEHDQVWLFSLGGLLAIRRLRFMSNQSAVALADNPAVPRMEFDVRESSFAVYGRVRWVGKLL